MCSRSVGVLAWTAGQIEVVDSDWNSACRFETEIVYSICPIDREPRRALFLIHLDLFTAACKTSYLLFL